MISPRLLIKTLYDHLSLVESLVLKSKDSPFFDRDQLFRISLTHAGQNRLEAEETIRTLISKEILLPVGTSDEFQIHTPVRDFVLSLAQESELGLAETIRVEVEEMRRIADLIQDLLVKNDLSAVQEQTGKLGIRMQAVNRQLDHDRQAILNIADRAKSLPAGTPLDQRYREVIDSFDRYVEPMIQLLAQDANGFAALTERIEDQMIHAETICEQIGALVSWKRKISSTARYLRTLRAEAGQSLTLCRETLLPLREEYLKNSSIAIAVAKLLGGIRKKGTSRIIPKNRINLGGTNRTQRVIPGRFAKAYMADLLNYRPLVTVFPESIDGPATMQPRLRFKQVESDLANFPSGEHLLPWLLSRYPEQDEKEILRIYHEIVRRMPESIRQSNEEQTQQLYQHAVRYYPHTIEVLQ